MLKQAEIIAALKAFPHIAPSCIYFLLIVEKPATAISVTQNERSKFEIWRHVWRMIEKRWQPSDSPDPRPNL